MVLGLLSFKVDIVLTSIEISGWQWFTMALGLQGKMCTMWMLSIAWELYSHTIYGCCPLHGS